MYQKNRKQLNEQGFASIAIALVLIAVLALLTVGFAQLARREQQTALNKQLASQAYYAAESGVNDAKQAIDSRALTTATANVGANQCLHLPLPSFGPTPPPAAINGQTDVSYTCVIVSLQPKTLTKDIAADGDWSTYFLTVGSSPDHVTLSWSSQGGKSPRTTASGFTPSGSWGARAVMQISITPLDSLARDDLINKTFTVYGYPSTSAGAVNYSAAPGDQGQIVGGSCTGTNDGSCHVTISGLPPTVSLYALHVHDYYDSSHVDFSAYTGANALELADSQATIDVTGKSREVLRRILVHVPLHTTGDLPNASLEAQNICKYFNTDPVDDTKTAPLAGYPAAALAACDVTN